MKLSRFSNLLIMLALVVGTLAAPAAAQAPSEPAFLDGNFDKVEALVLDEIAAEGQTEFFVWMVEKADLSPADQLRTKQEKGQFVFNTLVETAERTQKDLRAYLDAQGVDYQAFYIANKILVRAGDQALVMDLAARSDVARITANHPFQLQEPFKEESAPEQVLTIEPNVTFINADDVWAMGYDGAGTVMAGNDTGLDEDHPAIAPHYRGCLNPPTCTSEDHNYNWWDATGTYPNDPWDGHGHGTHTTGTMVGDDGGSNQIGVAPGAQTVHCKNMTDSGSGSDATFTECFQWDLAPWDLSGANPDPDMAPDAINNSWGYQGGGNNVFRDEIQALHAAGILVEVSAGNEGSSCQTLRSPADYWEVMTTGSVNHAGGVLPGTITGFSSRGPSDLDPTPPNYFPDIMAPGENIRSSVPGGTYEGGWSGTSMAGPHATALVGLMWSACPAFIGEVESTIQIIQDTAVPLTGQGGSACGGDYTDGPNNDWGFGTIDAYAAVQAVLAQCTGIGALDGTVTDNTLAAPIEGATITAEWDAGGQWSETTDASGYYTMTLPNGTYTVTAEHFGHLPATVYNVDVETDTVTTENFNLTVATYYEVSGYVREDGTNDPLEAQVEVLGTPLAPIDTDPATGYYSVSLPEDTYTFRVTASQHGTEVRDVVVDHDQTQNFYLAYQGQWEFGPSVAPFQYNRFDGVFDPYDNIIYFLGGRTGASAHDRSIWTYDPVNDVWADTGCDMNHNAANITIALINDDGTGRGEALYVVGGYDVIAAANIDIVQRYYPSQPGCVVEDVTTDPYPDVGPAQPVGAGGVGVLNDKIYVFGGWESTTPYFSDKTWEYDPLATDGNRWTEITTADMSVPRAYIQSAVHNNLVYAMGGHVSYAGSDLVPTNLVEVFDPANPGAGWTALASMPVASAEGRGFGFQDDTLGVAQWAGKIYVVGGGDWPDVSAEVMEYDVDSDIWNLDFPDLNQARRNHAGVFVPLCTDDIGDGFPGMWVFGGRTTADDPPFGDPEFYPLPCGAAAPELSITKTVEPPEPTPGGTVTYTLTFTNAGDADALGAIITDELPAEVIYVSSDPAGTYDPVNHEVLWAVDIISDTSDTIDLIVEVDAETPVGAEVWNSVTLQWDDQAPATAEVSFVVFGPPSASFTTDVDAGCPPLVVQFTDTSFGLPAPDEWLWDFGDEMGTSTEQNPVYTYTTSGDFEVTLWVTNVYGSDWTTGTITAYAVPGTDFSWEPATIYTDTAVQFTDLSSGPVVEWAWDFGDGYTDSISNPVHTFFTTGTFTVTLWTTTEMGCADMAEQMLTVEEQPIGPPLHYVYLPIVVRDN
jgi:uncharacterized repeat protein (TIGR01451 family)